MEILNNWSYRKDKARLRSVESPRVAMELATSIASYDALVHAGLMTLELSSLQELPTALIQARIARGWTQEHLARKLRLPKQQIQRYEATAYASASLRRLLEVAEVLDLRFAATVEAGLSADLDHGLARTVAGYAAAASVQQVERRLRLHGMTPKEARRIFDELCDTYDQLAPLRVAPDAASPSRIDHRLALRNAMRTLAGGKSAG